MKHFLVISSILVFFLQSSAQSAGSKIMDHTVWNEWNSISNEQISHDGQWIHYTTSTHVGDPTTHLYHVPSKSAISFSRADKAELTSNNQALILRIKPKIDLVKELKRKKTKKSDMPKDTLGIYYLGSKELVKKSNLQSFKVPLEDGSAFAYQILDTNGNKKPKAYDLVIHHIDTKQEDTIQHISEYSFSRLGNYLAAIQIYKDSSIADGVRVYNPSTRETIHIYENVGKYSNLAWDENGSQLAFLADLDTTKHEIRNHSLFHWKVSTANAREILNTQNNSFPQSHSISKNFHPRFSKDGGQLLFGIAPPPKIQDTTLLEDEIVNVEVWSYDDDLLYTQQEARLEREKKLTYRGIYDINLQKPVILNNEDTPEISLPEDKVTSYNYAIASDSRPYQRLIAWEGTEHRDLYLVNVNNGKQRLIKKKVDSRAQITPNQKYAFWYQESDTAWFAYAIDQDKVIQLTSNKLGTFYDEINDRPMHPNSYRSAGWTKNDDFFIVYDRYDIWKIDPTGVESPKRLTDGRADKVVYRYVRLDPEISSLDLTSDWICSTFDERSKASGYVELNPMSKQTSTLVESAHRYGNITKAKEADIILFTKQDFRTFPDIHTSSVTFDGFVQVSDANPQQEEYQWGNIELFKWVSSDGIDLEGMLVKPENFDPSKKYPLMVNFYEKSSNRLHSYPTMSPGRSSINYGYYVNQGYIIFNPNIPYKIGWPGESAYNAVISGITALIQEGFIDKKKIGVQGHSWGGYQIAHLISRSNIFACAEAGAPVVNMFSAYGGIRWGTGMSRMFQYEHTQSRIGGTIWDKTIRYFNNSPLFFTDKIETPVLILHNDDDSAVPWYQGIEFFVSLRRLDKPAWLLNYNGEPHGITKWQNRVDFQRRMSQFFDHYLLDKPIPQWMSQGIPAIEKSITTGFETESEVDHNR